MFNLSSTHKPPMQNEKETVLAHISDPHLPPPPIQWRQIINKRALSLLSWKIHRKKVHLEETCSALINDITLHSVNALLVSGDVTNFGTPQEFSSSIQWFNNLPAQPFVIPGNHDCMVKAPYDETLKKWHPWSSEVYPYVKFINKIAIIGINSALPTAPFMAYGRVGKRQLNTLEKILLWLEKYDFCRVVMIHHPPKKGLVPWRKSLLDHRATAKVIQKAGAEIVLHGHSHNATLTHIKDTDIPLIGVASASLSDIKAYRQACWNKITITPQHKTWTINLSRHKADGSISERASWERPRGTR
ncbi:metallophosphoesterase family protein [Swingsia samuiensis]|uniref:Metallophosphoesterase n=1 Tax=Swingsia samuiensis TaxID=1293412 RepID=A0A4Y6UNT0_9PROT|nr:metallophosphoesterase [Swingsia samuiensis]QDH17715.1 metallophosphoesterase [Swingsia samuiensis]